MANKPFTPEAVTGNTNAATITDKKGYGQRWQFSTRTIDNFLRQGLPHLKIGSRRVRIVVEEADAWLRQKYATQRCGRAKS